MLTVFITLILATLAFGQVNIETPSFSQCETATISWSGGSAPYTVYIYPEFYLDPGSFLQQIGPVDGTSTTYLVNLKEGDKLRVNVRDSANTGFDGSAFVGPIQVGAGSSDSCLASGPFGTLGLPNPTGTDLPSIPPPPGEIRPSFSSVSLPSIPTFDPSASATSTTPSSRTSVSIPQVASSAPSGSATAGGSTSSRASLTGPVNGDEPAQSDSPNAAYASWDRSSLMVISGIFSAALLSFL